MDPSSLLRRTTSVVVTVAAIVARMAKMTVVLAAEAARAAKEGKGDAEEVKTKLHRDRNSNISHCSANRMAKAKASREDDRKMARQDAAEMIESGEAIIG